MSTIADLNPDGVFAAQLDKKVVVHTAKDVFHTIRVYKYGRQPNVGVDDEFVVVRKYGTTSTKLTRFGLPNGPIAVTVYCKMQTNGTFKENRISEIISQIEESANSKKYGNYFYEIEADNIMQDTTPEPTSGYSTTAINVWWEKRN